MGQYWRIINLDTEEAAPGFATCLNSSVDEYLLDYLRYPQSTKTYFKHVSTLDGRRMSLWTYPKRHIVKFTCSSPLRTDTLGVFSVLPVEIITLIINSMMVSVEEVMCLAFTSQRFFELCIPRMDEMIRRHEAEFAWYGHRIICVGDYVEEPPDGVLTEEETEYFMEQQNELRLHKQYDHLSPTVPHLYSLCNIRQQKFDYARVIEADFNKLIEGDETWEKNHMSTIHHCLLEPEQRLSQDGRLVLRNLSKRVYVREAAILQLQQRMKDDGKNKYLVSNIMLRTAIMMRICWSGNGYKPHERGAWAGDRFGILHETDFDEKKLEPGEQIHWVDETEEIVNGMEEYLHHYGV